jgi:hypothetical protein
MANLHISRFGLATAVVLFSGLAVSDLTRDGWTKQSVRQYLYENACWSLAELKKYGAGRQREIGGHDLTAEVTSGDEEKMFSILHSPEALLIAAAGGFNIAEAAIVISQAEYEVEFVPVTKEIKLPQGGGNEGGTG